MSGDVGSLTVEILPIDSDDVNVEALFSIQGNQGSGWQQSPDIRVTRCSEFKVSYNQ